MHKNVLPILKRTRNGDNQLQKKKKMKLLSNEQQESYEHAKICSICKELEKVMNEYAKDKKYCRVRDYCHYAW